MNNWKQYAILGAKYRLKELILEVREVKSFLNSGKRKYKVKAKRKMSAAARKAISIRMKAHFAAKRNGFKK